MFAVDRIGKRKSPAGRRNGPGATLPGMWSSTALLYLWSTVVARNLKAGPT